MASFRDLQISMQAPATSAAHLRPDEQHRSIGIRGFAYGCISHTNSETNGLVFPLVAQTSAHAEDEDHIKAFLGLDE